MQKKQLRETQRTRCRQHSKAVYPLLASFLEQSTWWQSLLEQPLFWGVYCPLVDEVDWKQVVLPWSPLWTPLYPYWNEAGEKSFRTLEGAWRKEQGILVPEGGMTKEPDVLVVPGLAFDPETGARLGRGGGWYDHYLEGFKGWTLALVPPEWEVSPLPEDPWDQRVDILLTMRGLKKGHSVRALKAVT